MKVRFAVSVGLGPPDPEQFASILSEVEGFGFDTIWLSDVPSMPSVDPYAGIAFAAGVTQRVKLGANFIPFGQQPYVFAHKMAQLDRLSGGRLLVTLVPGLDLPKERVALGTSGRHRGHMLDRLIPQFRALWEGGDAYEEAVDSAIPLSLPVRPLQLSIGYAREPEDIERAIRLRPGLTRGHSDLSEVVPVGRHALRSLASRLVDQGLSKFVVRPMAPIDLWSDELDWLANAILDLQT